jgi:hypothetical protein
MALPERHRGGVSERSHANDTVPALGAGEGLVRHGGDPSLRSHRPDVPREDDMPALETGLAQLCRSLYP